MERLVPTPAAEPIPPVSAGFGAFRTTLYSLLAIMLAGGAWVRFNSQIADVAPALAGPAAAVADQLRGTGAVKGLIELAMIPANAEPAAVARMGLPPDEAAQLTAALRRGRLRLVSLPLIDATETGTGAGHAVQITAAGFTRLLELTRTPMAVVMPISAIGTVSFRNQGPDPVSIGGMGLEGPVRLPDISAGQSISVGVLPQ